MNDKTTSTAGTGSMPVPPREVEVAHHEAAHALVAHVLGDTAYGAAIYGHGDETSGLAGRGDHTTPPSCDDYTVTRFDGIYAKLDAQEILNDAAITAAGYTAAAMLAGDTFATKVNLRSGDRVMVNEMARTLSGEPCHHAVIRAFEQYAIARARSIIGPRWHIVEAIATALVEKRILSAQDIAQIIAANTSADV